jgi:hypothetical protein
LIPKLRKVSTSFSSNEPPSIPTETSSSKVHRFRQISIANTVDAPHTEAFLASRRAKKCNRPSNDEQTKTDDLNLYGEETTLTWESPNLADELQLKSHGTPISLRYSHDSPSTQRYHTPRLSKNLISSTPSSNTHRTDATHRRFLAETLQFHESTHLLQRPGGRSKENIDKTHESGSEIRIYTRKAICVLSRRPYFSFFRDYLGYMHSAITHIETATLEKYIHNLLYDLPPAPAGNTFQLTVRVAPHIDLSYRTLGPLDLPFPDVSLQYLFYALDVSNVLILMNALLTEKRVLLVSRSFSLLTYSAETILALIYPLRWPHPYIPVLPKSLLEYVQAPTPFIMGVHRDSLDKISNSYLKELVVIDLDQNIVLTSTYLPPLPPVEARILKSRIKRLLHPEIMELDLVVPVPVPERTFKKSQQMSFCENEKTPQTNATNCMRMIQLEFLKFFLSLFDNFYAHLSSSHFEPQTFLAEQPPESRKFLEELIQTQSFYMLVVSLTSKKSTSHFFSCLLLKKISLQELKPNIPDSMMQVYLPSPITEADVVGPFRNFPSTIPVHREKEMNDMMSSSLNTLPLVPQRYLFHGIVLLRKKNYFDALIAFNAVYSTDIRKEYPLPDSDVFAQIISNLSPQQLKEISQLDGPIGECARRGITDEQPNFFEDDTEDAQNLIQNDIFNLQPISVSSGSYIQRPVFLSLAVFAGLARGEEHANVLFNVLLSSQKKSNQSEGLRGSVLLALMHHISTLREESMPHSRKECDKILISFSHVSNHKGRVGTLLLSTKRIIFKPYWLSGKSNFRSHEWSHVREIVRDFYDNVIGGRSSLRVMTENKAKGYLYQFWTKEQRELCFMHMTELCVAHDVANHVLLLFFYFNFLF